MPSISMNPRDRYVTQSGVYGTFFLGQLTDRKIKQYALAGRYGEEAKRLAEQKKPIRKAKLVTKRTINPKALLEALLA